MKSHLKQGLPIIMMLTVLTSCDDMSKNVEDKLNELNTRTEQLDSLVNKELDKVRSLDTLINFESDKIQKLDSLIEKSTFLIDSIARQKIERLNEIVQ